LVVFGEPDAVPEPLNHDDPPQGSVALHLLNPSLPETASGASSPSDVAAIVGPGLAGYPDRQSPEPAFPVTVAARSRLEGGPLSGALAWPRRLGRRSRGPRPHGRVNANAGEGTVGRPKRPSRGRLGVRTLSTTRRSLRHARRFHSAHRNHPPRSPPRRADG
jgi:hypothetical protein